MTEGEKLERLLDKYRIQKVQFARHADGVSKTAVGNWCKQREPFGRITWKKIKMGLAEYKIDPAEIRIEKNERPGQRDELTRQVMEWPDDQIVLLRTILETHPDASEMIALMAYIRGRLQKSQTVK